MNLMVTLLLALCIQLGCLNSATATRCTDEFLRHILPTSLKRQTITIATISDFSPFIKRDGLGVPCGFDVDLMNLIGSIYHIEFKYEFVSPPNLITSVQNSTTTISITNQVITEERMQLVNFVQFFRTGITFIAKSSYSSSPINQFTDLCGKTVAAMNGTLQLLVLQNTQNSCAQNSINIVVVSTFSDLIHAVQDSTAELGFQDQPALQFAVIQSNGTLKLVGDPYYITPRGILCNKNNEPLCCMLTNAINYLIRTGIYEQLLKRYSFSYKNNGVCPSRLNLEGTTCNAKCVPSNRMCQNNLN